MCAMSFTDSKRWSPEVLPNNSLGYPIGLQFHITQVLNDKNKAKTDAMIVKTLSKEENLFNALFDKDDVDFEIGMKNSSKWDVRCTIEIGNSRHSYIIPKGCNSAMKALESNGKHLHFVSQATDDGKLLVAMNAKMSGVTYEEAAVNCSRIKFTFTLDDSKDDDYLQSLIHERERMNISRRLMELEVRITTGRVFTVRLRPSEPVWLLKKFISVKEGIPSHQQRLIFGGKILESSRTLAHHHINHGSMLDLSLHVIGGCGVALGDRGDPEGDRGVVCFGQQTNQRFVVYNKKFADSSLFFLGNLTLELRTKPKFSLTP